MNSSHASLFSGKGSIVPLVLHRIVQGRPLEFEDVTVDILDKIIACMSCNNISDPLPGTNRGVKNRCLLTFDDGYLSDYEVVFPKLRENGLKSVFFIITERVGLPGYLNWSQISEMSQFGMEIGSHSVSHPRMTLLSPKQVEHELLESKHSLEDRLGFEVSSFSFPYGNYSRELITRASDAGYANICISDHGVVKFPAKVIPRNSINGQMNWESVERVLDPSVLVQINWQLEDYVKRALKSIMSEKAYTSLRSSFAKGVSGNG